MFSLPHGPQLAIHVLYSHGNVYFIYEQCTHVCVHSELLPPDFVCTEWMSHDSLHPAMLHGMTEML